MEHSFSPRCDPRNPDDAFIATVWGLWGMPIICLAGGGILLSLLG